MAPALDEPSVEANGTRFDSVEAGHGEPLVLVHGSASDRRTWHAQITGLAEGYRVLAYSRRYHWPNQPIGETTDYAMEEQVADLIAVLEAKRMHSAHLVGHSYGGLLCLLVATRRPELVRSLVLVEPPALTLFVSPQPKPLEILRVLITRPRTGIGIAKLGATGFAPTVTAIGEGDPDRALQIFGRAILGSRAFEALSAERLAQARSNFIEAEFTGSGLSPLDAHALGALSMPVLLMNGRESPRVFHRLAERLAELISSARRVEIPRASHIVHEDNPTAFTTAVRSFLEQTEANEEGGRDPD